MGTINSLCVVVLVGGSFLFASCAADPVVEKKQELCSEDLNIPVESIKSAPKSCNTVVYGVEGFDSVAMAATPRADGEAEWLALSVTTDVAVSDALYERVTNDLTNIRTNYGNQLTQMQTIYGALEQRLDSGVYKTTTEFEIPTRERWDMFRKDNILACLRQEIGIQSVLAKCSWNMVWNGYVWFGGIWAVVFSGRFNIDPLQRIFKDRIHVPTSFPSRHDYREPDSSRLRVYTSRGRIGYRFKYYWWGDLHGRNKYWCFVSSNDKVTYLGDYPHGVTVDSMDWINYQQMETATDWWLPDCFGGQSDQLSGP